MPSSFTWLVADQHGRLALLEAERWGTTHRRAPLVSEGGAASDALLAAWVREVAPRIVFEHHDLAAVPESTAPHLVAFRSRAPDGLGGRPVGGRCLAFERPSPAVLAVLAEDLRAAEEDDAEPTIVGSLALDDLSFEHHLDVGIYVFARHGDDPRYFVRGGPPPNPLDRRALGDVDVPALDVDFTATVSLELEALVRPEDQLRLGR